MPKLKLAALLILCTPIVATVYALALYATLTRHN